MVKPEHRSYLRKSIRISCVVQFVSGITLYGQTKDIGLGGITFELSSLPTSNNQKINLGESGLLSLRYIYGTAEETIRVQCQVIHMSANGMGLSIRFYELNKQEQKVLGEIIAAESAAINTK